MNGRLYTAMGFDGIKYNSHTYEYDPITDIWIKLTDAKHAYLSTTGFAVGNNFYVGSGYEGRNLRSVFSYHTESNKWTQIASLPEGRILSNGMAISSRS